jgi:hypothetical protein
LGFGFRGRCAFQNASHSRAQFRAPVNVHFL